MALAVTLTLNFRDDKGKSSKTEIHLPTGFTLAQYAEWAQAAAQIIATATTGAITKATLSFGVDLSGLGLKAVAGALSDVAQKAQFIYNTAVSGFTKRFKLPAIFETMVSANSDAINTEAAEVIAFNAAMENGIVVGGTTVQPTDARTNDITSLAEAREQFRDTL